MTTAFDYPVRLDELSEGELERDLLRAVLLVDALKAERDRRRER